MADNKTVKIRMAWTQCNTDPIQYKPLSPTLIPQNVYVVVEIPNDPKYISQDEIIHDNKPVIVLTPDGMALAMQNLAKAIRATYSESK